ncbi:MAG: hypothetical protein Q7S66_05855 [bacterium]|nr:hypothetical protein [bacterium]
MKHKTYSTKRETRRQKQTSCFRFYASGSTGFTILELIIYISVLIAVSVVSIDSLLRVQAVFVRARLIQSINTSGELISQKILREVRLANDISTASSIFDANPGVLVIDTVMSSSDPTPAVATISLVSGVLQFQRAGQPAEILSSPDVTVTNLIFRNITQSSVSKAVRVEFALEIQKGRSIVTSNFYGTSLLKNSY